MVIQLIGCIDGHTKSKHSVCNSRISDTVQIFIRKGVIIIFTCTYIKGIVFFELYIEFIGITTNEVKAWTFLPSIEILGKLAKIDDCPIVTL